MSRLIHRFILLALMLVASGMAVALRPTQKLSDIRPPTPLADIVPRAFGEWREEEQFVAQIIDPQQKEEIDRIYNQTLARTYVNGDGYRIMLSIAYGKDQRDSLQVHKPEICYPAQGFVLQSQEKGRLELANGSIPVTRIVASQGQRNEPVTYWITIGDQVILTGLQKKYIEVRNAMNGLIADGLLVRVSSLDPNVARAYSRQQLFAREMINAIPAEFQPRLVGNEGGY